MVLPANSAVLAPPVNVSEGIHPVDLLCDQIIRDDLATLIDVPILNLSKDGVVRFLEDEGTLPQAEGQGRVCFMTIHGSKGLEAPVVLLVDAYRNGRLHERRPT